jgi:hypothetical protein
MVDKKNVEGTKVPQDFLTELREFAIDLSEECPEGYRKEPGSGRCLPMGSTDDTIRSRSINHDDGPAWRGTASDEDNTTQTEVAIDANDMDEPESCSEGTTFSFIQRRCVTLEDAETETSDEFAMNEENEYVEDSAAPGVGGSQEIVNIDPEGRRDTVNFQCPPKQMFDFKLRKCIPLNKDTLMASTAALTEDEKQELARYLSGKVAMTSPDPIDGHTHLATLDMEGAGKTSIAGYGQEAHSHNVSDYVVADHKGKEYTSRHFGHALPQEVYEFGGDDDVAVEAVPLAAGDETAAPIKSAQRRALPDSAFGVPGQRKFPLDTCARVRNAMARFNQAKGISSTEKASLRRKILARAKACSIEVTNFAKAETVEEFTAVLNEMLQPLRDAARAERMASYESKETSGGNQGPCPPGMEWSATSKSCSKMQGFYDAIKDQANHAEIVSKQPDGRRDTVNHDCPPGQIFDYGNRKCIPMDTSSNPGQPGDTTKASDEDAAQRNLTPQPEGRPTRLSIDCPKGTIWNGDRNECIPLDSSKKTKSETEEAELPDFIKKIMDKKKGKDGKDGDKKDKKKGGKPDFMKKKSKSEEEDSTTNVNGPGNSGGPGCPDGQFMNPVTKKCTPRKGAFKGSEEENADAKSGNREGLTPPPAGKVRLPSDCPPDTGWDAKNKICRPLDSMDKSRPDGASPQNPKSVADVEDVVENMSLAKIIATLDDIINEVLAEGRKEKADLKVAAKDLPNEAFPPSLVSNTRRSLMHHSPDVTDPYDTASVDVPRLRNALARSSRIDGYAEKAVADAQEHLLWHARQLVSAYLGKA